MTQKLSVSVDRRRIHAALFSLLISLVLFAVKVYAYHRTKSAAVYSDALESIVNILGSIMALISIVFASRPADEGHPYGHGKIEFLSATFEGGMIGFAGIVIAFETVQSWISGVPLTDLSFGLFVVFGAGLVNLASGLFLVHQGKKFHSEALHTDGKHLISDFTTSAGVTVGLLLVQWTGFVWIDKLIAFGVCFYLWITSFRLVRQSVLGLLDAQSRPHLEQLVKQLNAARTSGIIHVHHLRLLRSGGYLHVDAHVCLPEFWTLEQCHEHIDAYEKSMLRDAAFDLEFHFHLDPCRKSYCDQCPVEPCPIRAKTFRARETFTLEKLLLRDDQLPAYQS